MASDHRSLTDLSTDDGQIHAPAVISQATRQRLLAQLQDFEPMLFEMPDQQHLDGLYALYDQWLNELGDSPEAIALCDALDDLIGAVIDEGDLVQVYLDLVGVVQRGGR